MPFKRENNAGIYLTVAIHLIILIVLMATKLQSIISEEDSFILDFTKEEQLEKEAAEIALKQEINKELDAQIYSGHVRNVVVDAGNRSGEILKDDRYENPSQVYDEARKLQDKLDAAKREAEAYQGSDNTIKSNDKITNSKSESYKGPSVISYNLKGRKALSLPVPAYKCIGGGDVRVIIVVDRKGYVTAASIAPDSSADDCLITYALKAARNSRFTASASSPDRLTGDILYRFIPQ